MIVPGTPHESPANGADVETVGIEPTQHSRHTVTALNAIRLRQADLKRQVRAGELPVIAAICHDDCRNKPIAKVLAWQYRWSEHLAELFLAETFDGWLSPQRPCGKLTARQRRTLHRALERCRVGKIGAT